MNTNVFITDDRLAFSNDLAEFLRGKGVKVCLTTAPNYDDKEPSTTAIEWNRASPFSLQSLALQLKNHNMSVQTAIMVFDGMAYQQLYTANDIISLDKACTDLITANATLGLILKTLLIKQGTGRLIFVHREPSEKNMAVEVASSAFVKMAENIAVSIAGSEQPNLQTLLTRLDGVEDESYIDWLVNQMELPVLSRNPGRWMKAGQKGFFSK